MAKADSEALISTTNIETGLPCLLIEGVLQFSILICKIMVHPRDLTSWDREISAVLISQSQSIDNPPHSTQTKSEARDWILQVLLTWMLSPDPQLDNVMWGRGNAVWNWISSNHEKFGSAFCGFESTESWNLRNVNPWKWGKQGVLNPWEPGFIEDKAAESSQ